jgi:hypothetical protein
VSTEAYVIMDGDGRYNGLEGDTKRGTVFVETYSDGSQVTLTFDVNGNLQTIKETRGANNVNDNDFSSGAQNIGGLPKADAGGFIYNQQDFNSFMKDQASHNPVEVAAVELNNGTYYVQPWIGNDATTSINNFDAIPGFKRRDVVAQYHTHPDYSGPSREDALASQIWNIPVNVFNNLGYQWQVYYSRDQIVPIYPTSPINMSYGTIIRK